MGKIRKSCAFLCLATFSLGLGLVGCSNSGQKDTAKETTFTVKFDSQGGSAVADQIVKYGEKAKKPADPTKTNFTFDAWYEDAVAVTKFDFDLPITANWTVYAGWKAGQPDPGPGPDPQPGPSDSTLYFRDAAWWNKDAAASYYAFDGAEFAAMEYIGYSGNPKINYWKVDLPSTATKVRFARYGTDSNTQVTSYWGAKTVEITLADRGSHNMYDISATEAAWEDQSKFAEGVWADYDYVPGGGGDDPQPQPGQNVTYTLTCTSDWDIHTASAVFYAWAWGEGIDGQWYLMNGANKVFTVELPSTLNKCKVVRMNPTGAPSWDDGVKWNESGEIALNPESPSASFSL